MKLCSICWNQSCKHEKCRYVEIDDEIVPTITLLNKKGYHTRYCCAGHEHDKTPQLYVMFQKPMYGLINPSDIGEGFRFNPGYNIVEFVVFYPDSIEEARELLKIKRAELYNYVLELHNISCKFNGGF